MKELKFVDVGEGITEGHVQKWLVKDGDTVKEDQAIVQVETDKAVVNVPSPIDGIIKIVAREDTTVHLGDVICIVGTVDELKSGTTQAAATPTAQKTPVQTQTVATALPAKAQPAAVAVPSAPASAKPKEIIAAPSVRKLARDLNVDIASVTGTGPGGRIMENDLRSTASKTVTRVAPPTKFSEALEQKHANDVVRIPMSMTRKAIARNMEESWKIPRATHMDLINATELWNLVSKEKQKMQQIGVHLTFLPFIIKALAEALKANPNFNASYDHETSEIIQKKYYNIGISAEADDGLKVMVIKGADKMSIDDIAKKIQELAKKIKDKTITIDEMRDTSITITSIGSLGGGFLAVPMINPPDVAIVGALQIRDWEFVIDAKPTVGKVMPFTITFDHRVVDGAEAVKLGNAFKGYLEDPEFLDMLG
jgi:pyruvate dehydrogenase E2 component (dihydrolipoamide acetyltransferase)